MPKPQDWGPAKLATTDFQMLGIVSVVLPRFGLSRRVNTVKSEMEDASVKYCSETT